MDYPKLRNLEPFPVTVSGKPMIGLRDPLNLTDGIIAFPHQLYPILVLFDGKHSIVDIQAKFMRSFGELLYREMLEDIIGKLDAGYFLDNENFQRMRKQVEDEFRNASVRAAALAGKAYDDSPEKLAEELDSFFSHSEGPGMPGRKRRTKKFLKGIIAPHIDLTRGGPCFAWAYKEIAEACRAKLFVVFGTSHVPTRQPFALTAKDFDTPFGPLKCNREIVTKIQERVNSNLFEDELVHRGEHSIEFQAVFLKYLFRERDDISIVPILCGSFHELMDNHASPADSEEVNTVYSVIREIVSAGDENVCFIAGADLAHVGPRFGDAQPMNEATLKVLESEDLQMLDSVVKLDPKTFLVNIEADGNRRRICGLPPIYAMLNVMQANSAKLLKYQQWPDADATVTFASIAFY
jgi:AmmeMemoRadiSam system protein B